MKHQYIMEPIIPPSNDPSERPMVTAASPMETWSLKKKIAVGAALVALFFVAIGIGIWRLTAAPVKSMNAYFAAVRAQEYRKAYNFFSDELKGKITQKEFEQYVVPVHAEMKKASFTNREIQGDFAELRGTITKNDGGVSPFSVQLVKERDAWKINAYRAEP